MIYIYIYISNLKRKGSITEKELKYFTIGFKKATNLGKLYLLPKIHKRLESVPGRPVISNCGTSTEKVSEFLDSQLKPVMQSSWSYIKDSGDFDFDWNSISYDAEKNIKLLLYESDQIIAKIEVEIQQELKKEDLEKFKKKYNQLEDKHAKFRRQLEKRRDKKWYKFKTRTNNGVQNETELIEQVTKNNN